MSSFNASVFVQEQMMMMMSKVSSDLAMRSVAECALRYNFDGDEAIRSLGLSNVHVERKRSSVKKVKTIVAKPAFAMPYNGEFAADCCYALRQNNGLYTQCQTVLKNGKSFCKQCQVLADKGVDGVPEYGTIQQRQEVDVFAYVDPKGRKPVHYTKVMKKLKVSQQQVLDEAGKFNININIKHFEEVEVDTIKRGRPASKASEKVAKEPKGAKGRPKKGKKVLQIEGDDDDLFATLVANANINTTIEEEVVGEMVSSKFLGEKKTKGSSKLEADKLEKAAKLELEKLEKAAKLESDKVEKAAKLELEKLEKAAKLESDKVEKAAKLESDKVEKAAKLVLEKQEKEAKLVLEKQEKAAKLEHDKLMKEQKKFEENLAKLQAQKDKEGLKLEKEAKLALEKQAKLEKEESKKSKKPAAAAAAAADEEPDVVKKIEFEGKKYLKSKKSGVIYDYVEYTKNSEQVVVGKWNDSKNKIDFTESSEESDDEYDM